MITTLTSQSYVRVLHGHRSFSTARGLVFSGMASFEADVQIHSTMKAAWRATRGPVTKSTMNSTMNRHGNPASVTFLEKSRFSLSLTGFGREGGTPLSPLDYLR